MIQKIFNTHIQILTLALVVFAAVGGATFLLYLHLAETGNTYAEQVQLVADTKEKERISDSLKHTLITTEDERAALEDYFLDVVQIAQFLETIEQYAQRNNIVMSSRDLYTTAPDELGIATVRIPYEVQGSKAAVTQFIEMMETLPYHSELQSVRVRFSGQDRMQAELEVAISYTTYD